MKTPESQLTAEQPSTTIQRLELTKRYILHPKTKKKPQRDGRRGQTSIK